LFSPSVIGAQGSEGADTNLNLAANELINSYSPQPLPLVHFHSDFTQTAAHPPSDATDCITDGVDGIVSAKRERAVIDTTDSIVNSIRCDNDLNETQQAADAIPAHRATNNYTVAERADCMVHARLTVDNLDDRQRPQPQRTDDGQGRDTPVRPTADVNNTRAHSDSIDVHRPMQTPDQHGQELEAIVATQGVTGRRPAIPSYPITADIPLDSADRIDSELAAIVTRSGSAAARAGASGTDTNRHSGSGERGNKQGNKRGQRDEAGRRVSSATGSACHNDTVTCMDTPNNPAGDDLSGDNRNDAQTSNDMTERRDAETDLHRKFNELANIDMSDVHYDDSEQTNALGDADKFKLAQHQCKTLEHLWTTVRTGSSELKIISGLLYKKIPVNITSTNEYALVVPQIFRHELITLAHDNMMGGHMGCRKTKQRIEVYFFWPRMHKMISTHVRTCHTCQLVKPLKVKERQPLQHITIRTHAWGDLYRRTWG